MKKKCSKCKIDKPIEDFSWKIKSLNKRQSKCKECICSLDNERYKTDETRRNKLRQRANEQSKFNRAFIKRYKKILTCKNCNDNRWYVLDFHHHGEKKKNISQMASEGCSIETIKNEIRKCVPVCANCHREIHYLENNVD